MLAVQYKSPRFVGLAARPRAATHQAKLDRAGGAPAFLPGIRVPLHSVQSLRSALRSALPALECVVLDWRHGVGRLTPDDAHPFGFSWRISPVQFSMGQQNTGEIRLRCASPTKRGRKSHVATMEEGRRNPRIHTASTARREPSTGSRGKM
jgi:hypothetical protein